MLGHCVQPSNFQPSLGVALSWKNLGPFAKLWVSVQSDPQLMPVEFPTVAIVPPG
jgi:hypothetical protein